MPGHQNGEDAQSLPANPAPLPRPQDSGPSPPPRDEGISAVIIGSRSDTSPWSAFSPLYREPTVISILCPWARPSVRVAFQQALWSHGSYPPPAGGGDQQVYWPGAGDPMEACTTSKAFHPGTMARRQHCSRRNAEGQGGGDIGLPPTRGQWMAHRMFRVMAYKLTDMPNDGCLVCVRAMSESWSR